MAYNPFSWFRKHQRSIFAVLTVMCMIVFIAQFGAGDVFQRAMAYFGGQGRDTGPRVVTLNGRGLSEFDLNRVANRRRLANDFLIGPATNPRLGVLVQEQQAALDSLLNKKLKSEEGEDNPLFGLRDIAQKLMMNRRQREGMMQQFMQARARGQANQQMMQFFQMQMQRMEMTSREEAVASLNDPNTGLVAIASRKGVSDNPDNLETLLQVGSLIGFELWTLTRSGPDEFYLGGNKQIDSLLDFVLWQQQADKLGIYLTDADLAKEISRDAGGAELFEPARYSLDREKRVTDFLLMAGKEHGRLTAGDLIAALKEEYRVAIAQSLLIGHEPGGRMWRSFLGGSVSPSTGTPDEFLKFYREFRTTLRVKLMPVSVDSFVTQVMAEPSDDELRKLFERYKDQEPNPSLRTPGFKEPRRVRGEYVIGSVETPYYRDYGKQRADYLADLSVPWRRAKMVFLAPALSPLGAGPLGQALAIAGPVVQDPIQSEYESYLRTTQAWVYPEESFDHFGKERQLQLAHVIKPAVLAQAVVAAGGPLDQVTTLYGLGTIQEQRNSIRFTTARLAGLMTGGAAPGLDTLLTAVALSAPYRPEVLPVERLMPGILATLQQKMSREKLAANIAELREELAKLKDKSDASAEMAAKRAKEMHLTFHRMPRPVAGLVLADSGKQPGDPYGVNALKDAWGRISGRKMTTDAVAGMLFSEQGTYEFTDRRIQTASDTEEFLFWRSEDLPARPRRFDEARADVVVAWKLDRARDLARRSALDVAARINKDKLPPADALRLMNEAKTGPIFELDGVAPLVAPKEVRPEAKTEYRRYEVPEALEAALPYPPGDLPKLLMEAKRPGEAAVFLDRPGRTFYVSVVEARDEPSVSDFKKLYERSPFRDPLYDAFIERKRSEYRKGVMEQLRREAGAKLDKEGRYDLPEGVRKRFTGQGDEEG